MNLGIINHMTVRNAIIVLLHQWIYGYIIKLLTQMIYITEKIYVNFVKKIIQIKNNFGDIYFYIM